MSVNLEKTSMISHSCYNFSEVVDRVLKWLHKYYAAAVLCGKQKDVDFPGLIFVSRKVDAEAVAEALRGCGIRAAHVHGDVTGDVRAAIKDDLRAGRLDIVACTNAWSTGLDIPELRTVVRTAGGSAPIGLKQQSGRGARLAEGKNGFTIWDLPAAGDKHVNARIAAYKAGGYKVVGDEGLGMKAQPPKIETEPTQPILFDLMLWKHRNLPESRVATPPESRVATPYGTRRSFVGTGGPFMSTFEKWVLLFIVVALLLVSLCDK